MESQHELWERARLHAESVVSFRARQMVGKAGIIQSELPDLRQDLLTEVWMSLPKFDRRCGTLEAFVNVIVRNAAGMILRHRRRLKRGGGVQPRSLDGDPWIAEKARRILSGTDGAVRSARLGEVQAACAELPPELLHLAVMRADMSVSAIVRLTGRRRREVLEDLTFIRAHLEARGIDAHF